MGVMFEKLADEFKKKLNGHNFGIYQNKRRHLNSYINIHTIILPVG